MAAKSEILLVDDEEGVRHSWRRYLTQEGHSVTTAADGKSALTHLSRRSVDLVIADLRMPGPDGLEVLQWIRERSKPTRFILLTGYGTREVEDRARALGAYEYLEKPVAPEILASVVAAALVEAPPPPAPRTEEVEVTPQAPVERETPLPAPGKEPAPLPRKKRSRAANLGLLAASPLLGLAFIVFLPVIGFGLFGYLAAKKLRQVFRPASWKGGIHGES